MFPEKKKEHQNGKLYGNRRMKRMGSFLGILGWKNRAAVLLSLTILTISHVVMADDTAAPVSNPVQGQVLESQYFGANLFTGNFLKTREDGLNPNYVVAPGDQVAVRTWGSVNINDVFAVDTQGNIFLPEIGSVRVEGVRNKDLQNLIRAEIKKVFINNFKVYTNIVSTQPVMVYVTGLVENPGRYAGVPSDSVLYFLDLAGGIDDKLGSYRDIEVRRKGKTLVQLDLYDFILKGEMHNPQLQDGDVILVNKRGPVVELSGVVERPYFVELEKAKTITGESLFNIIPSGSTVSDVTHQGIRSGKPTTVSLSLEEFKDSKLRDGDRAILRADGRSDTILVRLEGEFDGPSVLSIKRGARLMEVLSYIPIDPEAANIKAVHLRRVSVAEAQKESIRNSLYRLERDALLALSDSRGEADIRTKEADMTQRFVEKARLVDPLGRVVTVQNGKQQNILLEPEDIIVIPLKTNVVRISGQVTVTQAVTHNSGWDVSDYIAQAGGYTDRADRRKVFLLRPNAEVVIADSGTGVGPGDEIIVPPKVDFKVIQNAADVMDIIYKIAVSAKVALDI
jgi:protein involved in polysaccharide export with SLBB domain